LGKNGIRDPQYVILDPTVSSNDEISNFQARKWWERIREIPEWIQAEIKAQGITPAAAIAELETLRSTALTGTKPLGTNALSNHLKAAHELAAHSAKNAQIVHSSPVSIVTTSFVYKEADCPCVLATTFCKRDICWSPGLLYFTIGPYRWHSFFSLPINQEALLQAKQKQKNTEGTNGSLHK
jgi:hypothetical protein